MIMQFNRAGEPIGGRVQNYLLEKNRVVHQLQGERSFHIFYQLLAGASKQEIQDLQLAPPEDFEYLKHGDQEIRGHDDAKECLDTRKAMDLVQIPPESQQSIYRVVAAVLHIGNINFVNTSGKDESSISNPDRLGIVARLLSCEPQSLIKALTSRTVRAASARSSSYQVPLTLREAQYSREALAKSLYGRLFDWLVLYINRSIQMDDVGFVIGVLDIYGFEIFGQNSFEQLCINYVNEKLQQIFIELTLKAEQEEYRNEGITWEPVQYFNNQPCVDLIDKHPMGIFSLLNEESLLATGTDASFRAKILKNLASNAHLLERSTGEDIARGGAPLPSSSSMTQSPAPSPRRFGGSSSSIKTDALSFLIRHYAGTVEYNAQNWLEKNKDDLYNDLKLVMAQSSNPFVSGLFPEIQADSKARPPPLAKQFKQQVADLMKELYACQPSYIRCIKPNADKRALLVDLELTRHQVRYLGLLENVRVRRAGYAFRQEFDKFLQRYKLLTKETWPQWSGTVNDGIRHILHYIGAEPNRFQFGKTKVFIRDPEVITELEEQRLRRLDDIAIIIQKTWRAYLARKYLRELKEKSLQIYEGQKQRRRASLNPRFLGDQESISADRKLEVMFRRAGDSKILFSSPGSKLNRSLKPDIRTLCLTDKAFYLLTPNPKGRKFKRKILLRDISAITLSTLCDGYVVLKVQSGDWVLSVDRKTELFTILRDAIQKETGTIPQISFADSIQVQLPGKKKAVLQFSPSPSTTAISVTKAKTNLAISVGSRDVATDADFHSIVAPSSSSRSHGPSSSSQPSSSSGPVQSSQFAALRQKFA